LSIVPCEDIDNVRSPHLPPVTGRLYHSQGEFTPTPKAVLDALGVFEGRKKALDEEWGGDAPWSDVVLAAMDVALQYSLIPSESEFIQNGDGDAANRDGHTTSGDGQ